MSMKKINKLNKALLILLMGLWASPYALAQDLEPRRWHRTWNPGAGPICLPDLISLALDPGSPAVTFF
jgi:hypothetical protein